MDGQALFDDLRERVIPAVDPGGLSCHRADLGWASIRPFSGFGASERPAAFRQAKWVGTNRRRFRGSTVIGCCQGKETYPARPGGRTRRARAEGRLSVGVGVVHAENQSLQKSVVAGERERLRVARRRAQWKKYQDQIDPERLVFIDET
jgi:hypothetical protein